MNPKTVSICIVSHDSAADLPGCFEAITGLVSPPDKVIVVDCASSDESLRVAREWQQSLPSLSVVALSDNVGFAGGMNAAIEEAGTDLVLSLNPDARPDPDFLSSLLAAFDQPAPSRIAAVTGRLRRSGEDATTLDACGMYLTLTWRHLDRGSGEADRGQHSKAARVFGATGAATLFSAEALRDAAVDGEIFLGEFHSYREDAELAFRLRERGWEIVYEPRATAQHARTNLPERRRTVSSAINYHSLKNRYLLRAYHQTWSNFLLTLIPTLARDLAAFVYVLAVERTSLRSYGWLWSRRRQIRQRRKAIQARVKIPSGELNRWFFTRQIIL